tara:strand:- start:1287 stop:2351 length:1065 start_codon:yes stop_codon:yes gene_type:complete
MFNEFGTPIGVESESMLPPGSIKPHERLIAESGVEMQWGPLAIGGAVLSVGASIIGGNTQRKNAQRAANRQYEAEQRAHQNQVAQHAYKTEFERLMLEAQNERTVEIYDKQLDQYREQIGLNAEAALESYAQEQRVLNEQWAHHAFRKQHMLRELFKIQGNQAAAGRGNDSKSLERANLINSLSDFGMEQHMLDMNLSGLQSGYRQRVNGISGQWKAADREAFSKIAIAPQLALPSVGTGPQLQGPVGPMKVASSGFGSFMGAAAQGVMFGSAIHGLQESDVELKENIKHVGKSPSGINIFEYNYVGKTTRHRGAMAQEVQIKFPEAVVEMENGYLGINYNKIDVTPKQLSFTK